MDRVWRDDIAPLLHEGAGAQRRKGARIGGKVAASAGLALDTLFRLRGKPFARAFGVLGTSAGAMIPDLWDWSWYRQAGERVCATVEQRLRKRAAKLEDDEALAFFDLPPTATESDLRAAWHAATLRWHPDRAPDDEARREYHLRFIAYQAAHARLRESFEASRLPRKA